MDSRCNGLYQMTLNFQQNIWFDSKKNVNKNKNAKTSLSIAHVAWKYYIFSVDFHFVCAFSLCARGRQQQLRTINMAAIEQKIICNTKSVLKMWRPFGKWKFGRIFTVISFYHIQKPAFYIISNVVFNFRESHALQYCISIQQRTNVRTIMMQHKINLKL